MINERQDFMRVGPILRPLVLSAGLCLTMAGCASVSDALPGAFNPPRMLPAISTSKTEAKAFKDRVKNDPFPTAGIAGSGGGK